MIQIFVYNKYYIKSCIASLSNVRICIVKFQFVEMSVWAYSKSFVSRGLASQLFRNQERFYTSHAKVCPEFILIKFSGQGHILLS